MPIAPIPEQDSAGYIAAGDCPIWGNGKPLHFIAMASHQRDLRPIGHLPKPQIFVIRAGQRAVSIRVERNGKNVSFVSLKPIEQSRLRHLDTGLHSRVPDDCSVIAAPRN